MQHVTWEYYISFHNRVEQEEFARAEALAEKEVQLVIGWIRWANITEEIFVMSLIKWL